MSQQDRNARIAAPPAQNGLRPGLVALLAAQVVSEALGIRQADLIGGARHSRGDRATALGRQIAVYLMVVVSGRRRGEAGTAFMRHNSTISHGLELIEALREVEAFDALIETLARRFGALLEAAENRPAARAWREVSRALVDALDNGELDPITVGTVVQLDAVRRRGAS